ncbi:MAG: tetratricopeptide repeat protein [Planctomycetota bacterium]
MERRISARAAVLALGAAALLAVPHQLQAQPRLGTIEARLQTGNGLLQRGLNDLAATEYRAVLADDDADRETRRSAAYGLGLAIFREGEFNEAFTALEDVPETGFRFSADAALLRGHCLYQTRNFEDAAAAYGVLLRRHGDHRSTGQAAAMAVESLVLAGEFGQARRTASEHGEKTDRGSASWQRLRLFEATAAASESDHGEAAQTFDSILRNDPSEPIAAIASLRRAQSLHALGERDDAREAFEYALETSTDATRADALLGLATVLRELGETDTAIARLDELGELVGSDLPARARYELGRALIDAGRLQDAEESLASVIDADDERLAQDASYWHAKAALRDGRADVAASRLERALELDADGPLSASIMYDFAVALERAGETGDALPAFRRFVAEHGDHPQVPDALTAIAAAELARENHAEAIEAAAQVLTEHDDHETVPTAALVLAESLYRTDRLDDAERVLRTLLRTGGLDDGIRSRGGYRLGMVLSRQGEHAEAAELLADAAETDTTGEFRPALRALADGAVEAGEWADAERYLTMYLDTGDTPADADAARLRLGLAQARQDKHDLAIDTLASIGSDAEDEIRAQAAFETGQSLIELGRDDEAEEVLEPLLEMAGSDRFRPFALRHLGAIAMRAGDPERAERFLGAAASAGGGDLRVQAMIDRGRALLAAGDTEQAAEVFSEARRAADGTDESVAAALEAVALARSGEHSDALSALRRADIDELDDALRRLSSFEIARALRAMGDTGDAADRLEELLDESSSDDIAAFAGFELALLEIERHDIDRAESLLSVLNGRDVPESICGPAAYQLAWSRQRLGNPGGAIEALETSCELGNLWAPAALIEGESLLALNRPRDAAEAFEVITSADEQTDELEPALLRLGEARAQEQNWAASRAAFERHLSEFESSDLWFRARFGAAWALENAGEQERAIESYRVVTQNHTGPTAARAQFQIGECLFALGRLDEAATELLRTDIVHAEPEWSAAALYEAGRVFEQMNKVGEARRQYRDVVERFGESNWATLAQERLGGLRGTPLPGRGGSSSETRGGR